MKTLGTVLMMSILASAVAAADPSTAAEQAWRRRPVTEPGLSREDVAAEVAFGRNVSARILARFRLHPDAELARYIGLVGGLVARNAPRPELKFRFAVLDWHEPAVFAAPGGYVFITKGALIRMEGEPELAAVLAHGIAHTSGRHLVNRLDIRGSEESFVSAFARIIGAGSHGAGPSSERSVESALTILLAHDYTAAEKEQADRDALFLCALAGYDPAALARGLRALSATKSEERTHRLSEMIEREGVAIGPAAARRGRFPAALQELRRGTTTGR